MVCIVMIDGGRAGTVRGMGVLRRGGFNRTTGPPIPTGIRLPGGDGGSQDLTTVLSTTLGRRPGKAGIMPAEPTFLTPIGSRGPGHGSGAVRGGIIRTRLEWNTTTT